jgi:hypothetical protein
LQPGHADDVLNNLVNAVAGPAATATSLGLPAAGTVPLNLNLLGAQFLNFMIGDLYDSTVSNYNVSRGTICTATVSHFDVHCAATALLQAALTNHHMKHRMLVKCLIRARGDCCGYVLHYVPAVTLQAPGMAWPV